MWRSPEGQSGKGVAKPSDIYSFGLVCIYGLGGGPMLILTGESIKALNGNEWPVGQEMVIRHFLYFGSLSEGLLKHVNDGTWDIVNKEASEIAEEIAVGDPHLRFERWSSEVAPHLTAGAKDMISKMMQLDSGKRAKIEDILQHPW
ncbi:unnamed protein product [Discula destructiva]